MGRRLPGADGHAPGQDRTRTADIGDAPVAHHADDDLAIGKLRQADVPSAKSASDAKTSRRMKTTPIYAGKCLA
jgi:hypothetical protein